MTIVEKLNIIKKEALRRPNAIAVTVLLVSLVTMAAGLLWPEKYESRSDILVDQEQITAPLMKGTAVSEVVEDPSEIARRVLHRRDVLEEIIRAGGWLDEKPLTLLEREQLMEQLRKAIKIETTGLELVTISYRNTSPERAFKVVTAAASEFMTRARESKRVANESALEFISAEVDKYRERMQEAERKLREFLAEHEDIRPGESGAVGSNIVDLRRSIQNARLDLEAARITERELMAQLEDDSLAAVGVTREEQLLDQLAEMENRLATLRLQYLDTYPDIVTLKQQIEATRAQLEAARSGEGAGTASAAQLASSPMRQQIRRDLYQVRAQIAALESRIQQSQEWLEEEYSRGVDVAGLEARADELLRDYEVTREIHDDLVRRRENARLAVNMEDDGEGLVLTMQEPPSVPLAPSGLQFAYFAMLGPLLGFAIAIGNVLLRVQFDDRIRTGAVISRELAIPVLGTVPVLADDGVRTVNRRAWTTAIAAVVVLMACYALVAALRFADML